MTNPIKRRVYYVKFEETLSLGKYQGIKPAISDSIEYDPNDIPNGQSEEEYRAAFKEKIRQEYFKLKEQMVSDFVEFANQVQKVYIPNKQ